MLPIIDRDGTLTGRTMIGTCVLLLIVTVLPAMVGMAGPLFLACASILGVCFLNCAIQFRKSPTRVNAKHVLRASLLYLTGLMLLLLCDGCAVQLAFEVIDLSRPSNVCIDSREQMLKRSNSRSIRCKE